MEPDNDTPWKYKSDDGTSDATAVAERPAASGRDRPPPSPQISWTASEYIDHTHGAGWYVMLVAGTLALASAVYLLTREYFATAVILLVGVIVGIFASRKPQQVTYEISDAGLRIGERTYRYSQFKSFAIIREGSLSSVNLLPLKRFSPPLSAYFPPQEEEQIVTALGEHLPFEERKLDR